MSCTCCVCAGLSLTRGFDDLGSGVVDLTSTKTITWADGFSSPLQHVVVDGYGPLEMQGAPGWISYHGGLAVSGSSVTFSKLDWPSFAFGSLLFASAWSPFNQTQPPASISPLAGSISVSLFGQSVSVSYALTLDELHNSINVDVGAGASGKIDVQWEQPVMDTATPLGDFFDRPLDGLADLLCWREYFNDSPDKWNIQQPQTGGNQSPPITSGYTLAHTLDYDNESVLLLTPGESQYSYHPAPVFLECVASGEPLDEQLPTAGFWTAATIRRPFLESAQDPGIGYAVTGPTGVSTPYINGNLIGLDLIGDETGMVVSLHRNGQQVLGPLQMPTRQQLFDATSETGSYLVTVQPTGSYGFPQTQLPSNKEFGSFVIDRTLPVVGFSVLDDIFVRRNETDSSPATTVVSATKPGNLGPFIGIADDESEIGVCPRPAFTTRYLQQGESTALALASAAGSYTVQLPFLATDFRDQANNPPAELFSQSWTVHSRHANFREETEMGGHSYYGAIPKVEDAGRTVREYYRPRLQSEKVTSLLLTFDRPVDPLTVNASQVRLFCNGQNVGGCTIEQVDATTRLWRITVPANVQQSATFCLLEYDPSGQVMTADVFPVLHFKNKDEFPDEERYPPAARGSLFRVVYVADDTKKRYSVAIDPATYNISYVEIGDANPRDWNGNPYDPEPSVIVTRTSWLMADVNGWPRLIDTSSYVLPFVIGRAASISAAGPVQLSNNNVTLVSDGDIALCTQSAAQVPDYGRVATSLNYDGYIPRVPTTGATGPFSYWGLETTIDPSPPALIPACAAPSEVQWHSSAIAAEEEITQLEGRAVYLDEFGAETPPPPDIDDAYIGGKVLFHTPGTFNHVAEELSARLLALDLAPLEFETQFKGYTLAQNLWACVKSGGGPDIQSVQMSTQTAYFIDTQNTTVTSSQHWTADNPHFAIVCTTQERTFGNSQTTVEEARTGLRFAVNDLTPDPAPIRSVTAATYSLDGLQAMLSACRQGKTYLGLKTTTLGPLVVALSVRNTIKAETLYEDCTPEPTAYVANLPDQQIVSLDDWLDDYLGQEIGGQPANFYYDAVEETWKLPPISLTVYCARGQQIATRTITDRVMVTERNVKTLTIDEEAALAAGNEVTFPLTGGYHIKLKRGA